MIFCARHQLFWCMRWSLLALQTRALKKRNKNKTSLLALQPRALKSLGFCFPPIGSRSLCEPRVARRRVGAVVLTQTSWIVTNWTTTNSVIIPMIYDILCPAPTFLVHALEFACLANSSIEKTKQKQNKFACLATSSIEIARFLFSSNWLTKFVRAQSCA